jgi:hypothetical protein
MQSYCKLFGYIFFKRLRKRTAENLKTAKRKFCVLFDNIYCNISATNGALVAIKKTTFQEQKTQFCLRFHQRRSAIGSFPFHPTFPNFVPCVFCLWSPWETRYMNLRCGATANVHEQWEEFDYHDDVLQNIQSSIYWILLDEIQDLITVCRLNFFLICIYNRFENTIIFHRYHRS